jgi:hypothetical protein
VTTESLEMRVRKLESRERRYQLVLRGMCSAAFAVVVAWGAMGFASKAQAKKPGETGKVVRANMFVMEDENGNTRAALAMSEGAPALGLYDEDGTPCAMLYVHKGKTRLALFDKQGDVAWQAP